MGFAKEFLKKFKKQENKVEDFIKEIPDEVLKTIEKNAIDNYIKSDEFESEVNTIIKTLGDEWYNKYKEKNTKEEKTVDYELKENKQMTIDDFNNELEAELQKNGFGKEFPR